MLNVIMLSVVAPYNEQAATAIVVCVEPSRDETRRDRECKNRDSAISSNCAFSIHSGKFRLCLQILDKGDSDQNSNLLWP